MTDDNDQASALNAQDAADFDMCKLCGEALPHDECRPTLRALNDAFRTDPCPIAVRVARNHLMITPGVLAHGNAFVARAVEAVRTFTDFTPESDPWGEHDFGTFELDGFRLNWKIDCYDTQLQNGSPDPRDPEQARRVLTILLAAEY